MKFRKRVSYTAIAIALASGMIVPVMAQTVPAGTETDMVRRAPSGAPNVVIVLLDDVGFGAPGTFGGFAATPTLDRLAGEGLRYNRFHTTAMCSPTRSALLTGRNPHATGIGAVLNSADSRPGYTGFHRKDTATIAEVLRQNGYSTAAFGKWHQTPDWELTQSGPFDRWPTGEGFEEFYGFHGGETDQFEPSLFRGTTPVLRPAGANYHLTNDLVDHSIRWLRSQHSLTPDKPFLLYLATGGAHAPLQAPPEYIARYRGKFDQGWDRLREETFARQKRLGIVPANARLTPRPPQMPSWDTLSPEQKRFSSRLMEAYAGFLTHTDEQVGRLVEALKASGQFDNTLFVYIAGDNGASSEGGLSGSLNYMGAFLGTPEPEAAKLAGIDRIGTADAYTHYNAQWAWAGDTPFQWTKSVASHLGGTRNGMVMTWPRRITDKGGLRGQFGHVNDIVPTILEATGIPAPEVVGGIPQKPMNGVSLIYSFSDAKAPERHTTQVFETFGHRSIYHNGWMASARRNRLPWEPFAWTNPPVDQDKWELYDLKNDFSQAIDLAAMQPARLAEMRALFDAEAKANNMLPISNQISPSNLPSLSAGRTKATYHMGTVAVPEKALPNMFSRSWSMDAEVDCDSASQGVVAAIGGRAAGWSLHVDEQRRPVFTYRMFELKTVTLTGQPLRQGSNRLRIDFMIDKGAGQMGPPATVALLANGTEVARDTLPASPWAIFSINETFGVGVDTGSPVGAYAASAPVGNPWRGGGMVKAVTIEVQPGQGTPGK